MDKISIVYQKIKDLSERIDSLVEEDKSIKRKFISILDWENEFQSTEIPRVSKRNKKWMLASLSCSEREKNEKRACIQMEYQKCLLIWENGMDFIEEFDLSRSKFLKEEVSVELKLPIEDLVSKDQVKIKNITIWTQQSFQKFLQLPFEKNRLIAKFEVKYQRKKKEAQGLIANC